MVESPRFDADDDELLGKAIERSAERDRFGDAVAVRARTCTAPGEPAGDAVHGARRGASDDGIDDHDS